MQERSSSQPCFTPVDSFVDYQRLVAWVRQNLSFYDEEVVWESIHQRGWACCAPWPSGVAGRPVTKDLVKAIDMRSV
jgi:hypothetical protein